MKKWMIEQAAAISVELEKGNVPIEFKNINVKFKHSNEIGVYAENEEQYKVILNYGNLELMGFCSNCGSEKTEEGFEDGCCSNPNLCCLK